MIGYRRGNWAYEWSQQAMLWQRKALEFESGEKACEAWLLAANLYSIAGYPHLKGDELADQATVLANQAYENSARFAAYELKKLNSKWRAAETSALSCTSRQERQCVSGGDDVRQSG